MQKVDRKKNASGKTRPKKLVQKTLWKKPVNFKQETVILDIRDTHLALQGGIRVKRHPTFSDMLPDCGRGNFQSLLI